MGSKIQIAVFTSRPFGWCVLSDVVHQSLATHLWLVDYVREYGYDCPVPDPPQPKFRDELRRLRVWQLYYELLCSIMWTLPRVVAPESEYRSYVGVAVPIPEIPMSKLILQRIHEVTKTKRNKS